MQNILLTASKPASHNLLIGFDILMYLILGNKHHIYTFSCEWGSYTVKNEKQ